MPTLERSTVTARTGLFSGRSVGSAHEVVPDSGIGTEPPVDPDEKVAGRKLIFGICSIALIMASVDSTIVSTALPRIDRELHAPINWASWTITVYQLGMIVCLPLAGKVSDQFGRKKVFVIAITIFTTASLLCGLSTSIYMLVALRFLQSLGGACFLPSCSGIVSDHFGKDRDRALGMFSAIFPMGMIAGPIFGGIIAQDWSWRGIFFINIPLGAVLVPLIVHFIPNSIPKRGQPIDLKGAAYLASTVLMAMLAITSVGEKTPIVGGSSTLDFAVTFVLAIVAGTAFVRHTRRAPNPFISFRLLFGRGFGAMNLFNLFYGTGLGFGALLPLYAVDRYHIGLSTAGTLLSARAIGMVSVSTLATFLLRRTGYRKPMILGTSLICAGLVFLSLKAPAGVSPYFWIGAFALVTGLGFGWSAPAANNATMQLAPENVASIAAQRAMFRQVGSIAYISIATAFIARSTHPGLTESHIMVILAVVLFASMGLIFRVPDHKGSW